MLCTRYRIHRMGQTKRHATTKTNVNLSLCLMKYRVILSLEGPMSTSTLWKKYYRIWRNAFKCAWM